MLGKRTNTWWAWKMMFKSCSRNGFCMRRKGSRLGVGIGKSTLARKIYNHPDVVAGPFQCRGWVVVSSEFTPQETVKQLMFDLPGCDKKELRELEESIKDKLYLLEKLKEMLYTQLEGKSYFIALADVWEKEHLESLITAFPNQQGNHTFFPILICFGSVNLF